MMNQEIQSSPTSLVIGLGLTGFSVVRYLAGKGNNVTVADSRDLPPYLKQVREDYPQVEVVTGKIPYADFKRYDQIIVSPGISVDSEISLIGDIELFARAVEAPIIAITGSNGKSTVTMLVSRMLKAAGMEVKTGGNIGTPALDLLDSECPDFYVLELSSFQLETTYSLSPVSAAVLNVSEDHMDRYENLNAYRDAKARIFKHAESAVINRDELMDWERAIMPERVTSFGLDQPSRASDFGIILNNGKAFLCQGEKILAEADRIKMPGDQNVANILAAMALVSHTGVELTGEVVDAALSYTGLPHRCELIVERGGVRWINDSKGTNVGATSAAIKGFKEEVILLAGGQGKGADFSPLADVMAGKVQHAILFGEDADQIETAIKSSTQIHRVDSLFQAVALADQLACTGQTVLFSPACASFDMFDNYEQRGDAFRSLVLELGNE